jgi:hypothetical protein
VREGRNTYVLLEGGTLELEGRGDEAVVDAELGVLQVDGLHELEAAQLQTEG